MNNHNQSNHIALIVDDEPDIRELLELTLSRMQIESKSAPNLNEAYALLEKHHFDLCLTDMRLPDGEGLELVKFIQNNKPEIPVAVITAYGSMQTAIDSLKAGAFDFVNKPLDLEKLRDLISNAIQLEDSATLEEHTRKILLGESETISRVRSMIPKLSRTQAPIFISGESGTGKELVARLIHDHSPRKNSPFVAVNCGAIPFELMESEFFGHKKGSFTGAAQDKEGLFQAADGGTLFLDEVADLPLNMQVKLLRAIQESAVRQVGGSTEQSVNVRILSATNKDLKKLTETEKFRNDLYFRLNVIELNLPPLRERNEDIEILSQYILKSRIGSDKLLSKQALKALFNYHFPGNIRELENILERATAFCEGNIINQSDLHLPENTSTQSSQAVEDIRYTPSPRGQAPLEGYLAKIEKHEIQNALDQCRWNRVTAARLLGLSPRQLRYRMSKLGMTE